MHGHTFTATRAKQKQSKFTLSCLYISQIALTNDGCSADAAWKTLLDSDENAEEDAAGILHVKPEPLRARAEAFLTKRRTMGEGMRYDVRSLDPCVLKIQTVVYNGDQSYKRYVCATHDIRCANHRTRLDGECETSYKVITALNKKVVSGCKCKG